MYFISALCVLKKYVTEVYTCSEIITITVAEKEWNSTNFGSGSFKLIREEVSNDKYRSNIDIHRGK